MGFKQVEPLHVKVDLGVIATLSHRTRRILV